VDREKLINEIYFLVDVWDIIDGERMQPLEHPDSFPQKIDAGIVPKIEEREE